MINSYRYRTDSVTGKSEYDVNDNTSIILVGIRPRFPFVKNFNHYIFSIHFIAFTMVSLEKYKLNHEHSFSICCNLEAYRKIIQIANVCSWSQFYRELQPRDVEIIFGGKTGARSKTFAEKMWCL